MTNDRGMRPADIVMRLPATECSKPFDGKIDFHDPLVIAWEYSLDDGVNWESAGTSANPVYVTLKEPKCDVIHTLVHIGCKNGKGETTEDGAIEKIWGEFTDRAVARMDGTPLKYYGSYLTQNMGTKPLLADGDGQCSAWVIFFLDTLRVQGINRAGNAREIVANIPGLAADVRQGFIVKNWTFANNGAPGGTQPSNLNIPPPYGNAVGVDSYNWLRADVNDAPGIPGQSNGNPASFFTAHYTAFLNGKYYDPSYGQKHNSLRSIQENVIEGFVASMKKNVNEEIDNIDLNNDGKIDFRFVECTLIYFRRPSNSLEIEETVKNL